MKLFYILTKNIQSILFKRYDLWETTLKYNRTVDGWMNRQFDWLIDWVIYCLICHVSDAHPLYQGWSTHILAWDKITPIFPSYNNRSPTLNQEALTASKSLNKQVFFTISSQ